MAARRAAHVLPEESPERCHLREGNQCGCAVMRESRRNDAFNTAASPRENARDAALEMFWPHTFASPSIDNVAEVDIGPQLRSGNCLTVPVLCDAHCDDALARIEALQNDWQQVIGQSRAIDTKLLAHWRCASAAIRHWKPSD